jgi:hypothetical protein
MKFGLVMVFSVFLSFLPEASWSQIGKNVNLFISVDWEGFSLDSENLDAFRQFRNDYPNIKIIHFLNAAYFTKPGAKAKTIAKQINSLLLPGDELGLHIHAFESLLRVAGVEFRDSETFWGHSGSEEINGDRGHDVPLSLYSEEEIRKIVRTSLNILGENGFSELRSFRAGGWIATPEVLEALIQEGIYVDSSAVSSEVVGLVAREDQPLYQINKRLWPYQTPMNDRPYRIGTRSGSILEFPDNIALADYITAEQAFRHFEDLVAREQRPGDSVFFHFGFHQETADVFLPRVRALLKSINQHTKAYDTQVQSKTFSDFNHDEFIYRDPLVHVSRACKKTLMATR